VNSFSILCPHSDAFFYCLLRLKPCLQSLYRFVCLNLAFHPSWFRTNVFEHLLDMPSLSDYSHVVIHVNFLLSLAWQVFDLQNIKPNEFVDYGLACLEQLARVGDSCAKETREKLRVVVCPPILFCCFEFFYLCLVVDLHRLVEILKQL